MRTSLCLLLAATTTLALSACSQEDMQKLDEAEQEQAEVAARQAAEAAMQPAEGTPPAPVCDASPVQGLVGQPADEATVEQAREDAHAERVPGGHPGVRRGTPERGSGRVQHHRRPALRLSALANGSGNAGHRAGVFRMDGGRGCSCTSAPAATRWMHSPERVRWRRLNTRADAPAGPALTRRLHGKTRGVGVFRRMAGAACGTATTVF